MTTMKMDFTKKNRAKNRVENVGYMEIKDAAAGGVEMYLYGDIVSSEWDKYEPEDTCPQEIIDFLSQIDDNADIALYINSGGGSAVAGIGIYNILKRHKGHIKGVVDGIAASIASVILMACDEITVSAGAQIMIHKPIGNCWGNADDFAQMIVLLNQAQQMITDIYMQKVNDGIEESRITEMINAETWLSGSEAAEIFDFGVANRGSVAACVSSCMMDKYKNVPRGFSPESVEDKEVDKALAAEILEDLDLYGI